MSSRSTKHAIPDHIDSSKILPVGSKRVRRAPEVYVDESYAALMLADVPSEEMMAAIEEEVSSDEEEEGEEESDEECASDMDEFITDEIITEGDPDYTPNNGGGDEESDDDDDSDDDNDDSDDDNDDSDDDDCCGGSSDDDGDSGDERDDVCNKKTRKKATVPNKVARAGIKSISVSTSSTPSTSGCGTARE